LRTELISSRLSLVIYISDNSRSRKRVEPRQEVACTEPSIRSGHALIVLGSFGRFSLQRLPTGRSPRMASLRGLSDTRAQAFFAQTLGHIMYYCQQNGLPPLTALVVKKETGLPGRGLTTRKDLDAGREEVFRYEWFKVVPPAPTQLGDAYRKGHSRKSRP